MQTKLMKLASFRETVQKQQRTLKRVRFDVSIKKVQKLQQIVIGEVYAPNIIDSHGEMMEAEDVEYMAHYFAANTKAIKFDVMHDNRIINAEPVESWIARGHPDWNEGAWILGSKIRDKQVWQDCYSGIIGGYSVEAMVAKVDAVVEFTVEPAIFGYVEAHDGHDHVFFATVNANGVITGGTTSFDDGHSHKIKFGTRTEIVNGHSHRYFLP